MTADVSVPRARTAAATEANRRRKAERCALEVATRLELLDDERLRALAGVLMAEVLARGLAVPDLRG